MRLLFLVAVLASLTPCAAAPVDETPPDIPPAPKPLYRDPKYDGAADATVIWNAIEEKWFMYYTNRRANVPGLEGVSWVHGTRIGIAESSDAGRTWTHRSEARISLGEPDDAHWAPEVVVHNGVGHMFLTLVPGMHQDWGGQRFIHHLTSTNLVDWADSGRLPLASDRVIDACVLRMPDGSWRMWYNNEKDRKSIYRADSPDLKTWTDRGKVIADHSGEGPKVVFWRGFYWMVVDQWKGLGVYRSNDAETWVAQPLNILATPGTGTDDEVMGGHPDLLVNGDRAWLFYFTHPGRRGPDKEKDSTEQRRSSIQVAEVTESGGWLECDRDQPARIRLMSPAEETFLFSYFVGNGEDGLHLAASQDGLDWRALNGGASYLRPTLGDKLMRDPCITRGPDGTFHMVWTTGWFDKGVGIAHSKDLVNWSEQTWLPVMEHEPESQNAWAPEITHDTASGRFMIYWSSTIPGRFTETEFPGGDRFRSGKACNHRIYCTFTSDFKIYTPTTLLYDPGFNCIDASIVAANGRWLMMIKDETKLPVARKNIRVAWADRLEGPWGPASDAISPEWVEGPTLFRASDDWILLYDAYTRHRYEGLRSRDLTTWEPISTGLNFPKGIRHGTVFKVPASLLRDVEAQKVPGNTIQQETTP